MQEMNRPATIATGRGEVDRSFRSPKVERPVAELRDRAAAHAYVERVCFKNGPPTSTGVELEWTVHTAAEPGRSLDAERLTAALGPHAPPTLAPSGPHRRLPAGAAITVEPGGQVEISSQPHESLTGLLTSVDTDVAALVHLLRRHELVLGERAVDARSPRRLLDTPRYAAMEAAFDRIGPCGRIMMCGTTALQIGVGSGRADRGVRRWRALHSAGPALVALAANSPRSGGEQRGRRPWASARLPVLFGTDPPRMRPPPREADPVAGWARRALDAPVICVRRPDGPWTAPPGLSFADWLDGALDRPPTTDDLDYHLTTMFPPVRPRGDYLEVRYLDGQPLTRWAAFTALLAALMAEDRTVDQLLDHTAETADRWLLAARHGLAEPSIARAAARLVDLGCAALGSHTDLDAGQIDRFTEQLHRLVDPSQEANDVDHASL